MAAPDSGTAGAEGATAPFIKLSACATYANKFVTLAGTVTGVTPDDAGYIVGGCLRVVPMDTTDEVVTESNVLLSGLLDSTGSTLTEKRMCTMLGPNFGTLCKACAYGLWVGGSGGVRGG